MKTFSMFNFINRNSIRINHPSKVQPSSHPPISKSSHHTSSNPPSTTNHKPQTINYQPSSHHPIITSPNPTSPHPPSSHPPIITSSNPPSKNPSSPHHLISTFFIFLWVYAASAKLLSLHHFRLSLNESPWLHPFAGPLSILLPLMEFAIAATLIIPRTRRAGLLASTILLALFTIYLTAMLLFAPHIPCSCGGILEGMGWRAHIAFNSSCCIMGILAVARKPRSVFIAINRKSRTPV